MAQGDLVFFDQFLVDVFNAEHDLSADTIKMGLTDGSTVPTAATADPRWGAGGTTNFASEEVTPGGNYSAGGAAMANAAATLNSGTCKFDTDDPATWAQHASNPTDATYGIIYNDTNAGKRAIGFVDLGGAFDMTTGPLAVAVNASGLSVTDQA